MNYTRDQKAKAFDTLPKELKDYFLSEELVTKIQSIGKENNLLIDKQDLLAEEIFLIILGLNKASDFEKNISSLLNVGQNEIKKIISDVNKEIFTSIRTIAMNEGNSIEKNQDDLQPQLITKETKENLMSAIENPVPTEHPISIAQPKPMEKTRPSSGATDVAHAFIGEKLSTSVSLPSQKVVVPTTNTVTKPKPSVDPYREPVN